MIYFEWVDYVQEVLDDFFYLDRIEWEKVEKFLVYLYDLVKFFNNKDVFVLVCIYGWDLDNEVVWSKVDFVLFGIIKGGKIFRVLIEKKFKLKVVIKSLGLFRKKFVMLRLLKVSNCMNL